MFFVFYVLCGPTGWLGSRVVSVLDSGAEGTGFKSQSRRCRETVLGKLFTLICLPISPTYEHVRFYFLVFLFPHFLVVSSAR